jgi:Kef-type K+ transport system membrane component KefB
MVENLITKDLQYLAVFTLVLILPKVLLRFKIPSGITAIIIGILFATYNQELKNDQLFRFLSQIGITSLFLFAGLEVEFKELYEDRVYLSKYLAKFLVALIFIAVSINYFFDLNFQNSLILSLGIFTPSAGFIMTSLHSFKVEQDQEYWVKSKAISKEVLSIILLFIVLQGQNLKLMLISSAYFVVLFLILPPIFKLFFKFISPYAPNSEIPFLVTLSLVSGIISKELGTYYLVGAFVVGLIGSRFKEDIFHEGQEALFRSLSGFFTVFLPFYFFYAGLSIDLYQFNITSVVIGLAMFCCFVPIRIFLIRNSLKLFQSKVEYGNYTISLSLMPTLIFGLVIASILLERNQIDQKYVYGLLIYTFLTSILPAFFFFLVDKFQDTKIDKDGLKAS